MRLDSKACGQAKDGAGVLGNVGLEKRNRLLTFRPCFPPDWPSISLVYRYGKSEYHITIFQIRDNSVWKMDGQQGDGNAIQLIDDGQRHHAEVYCAEIGDKTGSQIQHAKVIHP